MSWSDSSQELQTAVSFNVVNILSHQEIAKLKLCWGGWEGGSVNTVLATQAQGPKFNPQDNTKQTNKSGVSYA